MVNSGILQSKAFEIIIANSTAFLFKIGKDPGNPIQIGHILELISFSL